MTANEICSKFTPAAYAVVAMNGVEGQCITNVLDIIFTNNYLVTNKSPLLVGGAYKVNPDDPLSDWIISQAVYDNVKDFRPASSVPPR